MMTMMMMKMTKNQHHKQIARNIENTNNKWNKKGGKKKNRADFQPDKKLEKWLVT